MSDLAKERKNAAVGIWICLAICVVSAVWLHWNGVTVVAFLCVLGASYVWKDANDKLEALKSSDKAVEGDKGKTTA